MANGGEKIWGVRERIYDCDSGCAYCRFFHIGYAPCAAPLTSVHMADVHEPCVGLDIRKLYVCALVLVLGSPARREPSVKGQRGQQLVSDAWSGIQFAFFFGMPLPV
jgi:hypothetical protein